MDKIQNIDDAAIVREIGEGFVQVEMIRSGSCGSCGLSGFCHGQDKTITHRIITESKYTIGDIVKIDISPGLRIKTSLLVFLFPILSMILFFSLARYVLILTEPISILISFAGLILSGIIIYLIDKKIAAKVGFEIVERMET